MKIAYIIFCSLLFVQTASAIPATVDYVFDGDTFSASVAVGKGTKIATRVRLINVDTPEMHGKCAKETCRAKIARERLMQLVPRGTIVELKNIKDDKYAGRIDANVILPDGRDAGSVLIKEKLGRPYSGGKRKSWCD